MPLNEISPNLNRSSSAQQHGASNSSLQPATSSYAKAPPTAVQSMLKSGTEIGDVGMFAHRPPRVARSATQSSLALPHRSTASSASYHQRKDPTQLRHPGYTDRPHRSQSSVIQRSSSVRSQLSGYHHTSRTRPPRARPLPYPPHVSRPIYSHASQDTLRSHRSLTSLRSNPARSSNRSPYLRPYPPPRVPSPAFSNLYDYRRPPRSQHGSSRTDVSSPQSAMSVAGRSLPDFHAEYNPSATSFRPMPSPMLGSRRRPIRKHSLARELTPTSTAFQHQRVDSTASTASEPASPTGSLVPFYYDYSESFHGRQALLPDLEEHPATSEDGSQKDGGSQSHLEPGFPAQSPFGIRIGSKFSPAELPTKHNRRASDISARHSRKASSKSTRSLPGPFRKASIESVQESAEPIANHTQQDEEESHSHPISNKLLTELQSDQELASVEADGSWMHGRHSLNCPRNWPSPTASTFFTSASRSPRNLSDLAARAHSPDANIRSIGSIDGIARDFGDIGEIQKQKQEDTKVKFQLPTFRFRPLSISISPHARPLTSPIANVQAEPEIISPRPERPMSSQSRKRFSKILDADQDQDTIDTYSSKPPFLSTAFGKLERVEEASSPVKTPPQITPPTTSKSKKASKTLLHSAGPSSTRERWSGVTSHDKSTVESLLERHIECLGLRPELPAVSSASSAYEESNNVLDQGPETGLSGPPSTLIPHTESEVRTSQTADHHRPTSLTSSAHRMLMPKRLFASKTDSKSPRFPLASDESDMQFSLTWTDERARPSIGWLPLPSDSQFDISSDKSRQTIMSGEVADVESGTNRQRFKIRRHSSPSLSPVAKQNEPLEERDQSLTSRREKRDDAIKRENSQKHRKLKIHLKTKSPTAVSEEWVSSNGGNSQSDLELRQLGLTRVPISAVDGFVELSGESTNASQLSLASTTHSPKEESPDTWSSIVAAMPIPTKQATGFPRKGSTTANISHKSKGSVVDPVNTSRTGSRRQSREVKAQNSIPRLTTPNFGPVLRASQFDLSNVYHSKSPPCKQSIFSEPRELSQPSPPKHGRHSFHGRGHFRRLMQSSLRSFTFSPPRSQVHQPYVVSQHCRVERPASVSDHPSYPETVAMSDFAYRK